MAHVPAWPAVIDTTPEDKPETFTGTLPGPPVPSPSSPEPLVPQHFTPPCEVSAQQ